MSFLKKLEAANRKFLYSILKFVLRTPQLQQPFNPTQLKKILLLRYDAIGDMLVTTPVFSLLREKLPNAELHVLASHRNHSLLRYDERIAKYFIFDGSLKSFIKTSFDLRNEKYGAVIGFVFNKTTLAGLWAICAGGRNSVKINMMHPNRKEIYSAFFNIQTDIEDLRDRTTMAEILPEMCRRAFGWNEPLQLDGLSLRLGMKNIEFADNFVKTLGSPIFFALNISSGNPFRRWSLSKNIELLKIIISKNQSQTCVILSAPEDFEIAEEIASHFDTCKVVPKTDDILNIAAVIARAVCVITPDTSIVHLAAANKIPVVVLYSRLASYIEEWKPFATPHITLVTEGREPIETIPTIEVAEAFFRLNGQ